MIRTNFRINVETADDGREPLDVATLCSVFKCASSRHSVVENYGLPTEQAAEDEHREGTELEARAEAREQEHDVDEDGHEYDFRLPRTANGRRITPKALDIYKETFAMRRSFGIPNTKRENIDTSNGKLPRILMSSVEALFPVSSEEMLRRASRGKPKTKRQIIQEVLDRFPRVLPALGLRVSLLHRPLWDAADEVARHNWKKIVFPQVTEKVRELQRDLLRLDAYSNVAPEVRELLRFERLELRFDEHVLSIANASTNRFGEVEETLGRFYQLLNDGVFGKREVYRVDAPFIDYDALQAELEARKAAAEAALEQAEQAALEAAEAQADKVDEVSNPADDEAQDELTEAAEDVTCEDDASVETPEGTEDTAAPEGAEEPFDPYMGLAALRASEQTVRDVREQEAAYELERRQRAEAAAAATETGEAEAACPRTLCERVWGITYADGTIAYLDTQELVFVEKPTDATPVDDEDGAPADEAAQEQAGIGEAA